MGRFSRAHLFRIGCASLMALSCFVLFDLLDIDGSSFEPSAGLCVVAEDLIATGKGAKALGPDLPGPWLATAIALPLAGPHTSRPLLRSGACRRPLAFGARPRGPTAPEGAPADRDSDPVPHSA